MNLRTRRSYDTHSSGDDGAADTSKRTCSTSKRKIPDVDLDCIHDPEERRRQKRLAKNRRTAAVSRDRKRIQMEDLQQTVERLEVDNDRLRSSLQAQDIEMKRLRAQLASSTRSVSVESSLPAPESAALKYNYV